MVGPPYISLPGKMKPRRLHRETSLSISTLMAIVPIDYKASPSQGQGRLAAGASLTGKSWQDDGPVSPFPSFTGSSPHSLL